MNKISLKFFYPLLEAKYQSANKLAMLYRFFTFSLAELFFCLLFLIFTMITSSNKVIEIVKFVCILLLILLLLFLKRISFPYLIYFLKIIFLGFVIFFTELIRTLKTNDLISINATSLVIPLQMTLSMLILTKLDWIICSCYYLISLIYFFFRIIDRESNSNPNFYLVIVGLTLSFFSFVIMCYTQEKMERIYYKSIHDSYESLNYFKLLLQNIMPSPIFIVDYEKSLLKFRNNSALKLLSSSCCSLADENLALRTRNCFDDFEKLMANFTVLDEPNQTNEVETSQKTSEVASLLKKYYKDEDKKPAKADSLSSNGLDLEFLTLNVSLISKLLDGTQHKLPYLDPYKNQHFYELKIVKIYWEDSICLLIAVNDNTNAFRVSELINLDMYKDQLLASVSHDLRTPLNGLNGMLELTIPRIVDKEIQLNLILASKSASLLNFLVNDILDYSQINFKKLRLNIEEISFPDIISEMKNLIEFQTKEKKIEFLIECPKIDFRRVYSDPNRLKQILLNLLSNSLKFTTEGHIKLRIEDFTEQEDQPTYKLTVEDTGLGIKEKDLGKLFQLFGRLEDSSKINRTGIGLGLTISKMLSKLLSPNHEEGLQVESTYGQGSRFYFFLKSLNSSKVGEDFERTEERTLITLPEMKTYEFFEETSHFCFSTKSILPERKNSIERENQRKILIVDDDLMNIMVAEQYLAYFKIKSLRATNGCQAVKIVEKDILERKFEISLIMMDCNMPIMDGFQASEKIWELVRKERVRSIPILAVTANLTLANKEECRKAGMEFFLEKPMRRDELKKIIEDILKIKIN